MIVTVFMVLATFSLLHFYFPGGVRAIFPGWFASVVFASGRVLGYGGFRSRRNNDIPLQIFLLKYSETSMKPVILLTRKLYFCIPALLLMVPVLSRPTYSYYAFLRVATCLFSLFAAYDAYKEEKHVFIGVFAVLALVFNPISPLRLPRSTWVLLNLVGALLFAAYIAFNQDSYVSHTTTSTPSYTEPTPPVQQQVVRVVQAPDKPRRVALKPDFGDIGRDYERYTGWRYENMGYLVTYNGILSGKQDGGIDLVCKKGSEILLIQCKCWNTPVRENNVNQLCGARDAFITKHYIDKGRTKVTAVLVTSSTLSTEAKENANHLQIVYEENVLMQEYPMIKCNVTKTGEKIYHTPEDAYYDKTSVHLSGEGYAYTEEEARQRGFRRAKL